jgi:hypothetical protein
MGREVQCMCRWADQSGQVKALLESEEIILRGTFKQRVPLAAVTGIEAGEAGLRFVFGPERIVLEMGLIEAGRWLTKIQTPPPSLRQKLGLEGISKALVVGAVGEPVLQDALEGFTTSAQADACMVIGMVENEDELAQAMRAHQALDPRAPIWIVSVKGKASPFGETRVREAMRARGFFDTKVASVSGTLTAGRYLRKK